MKIGPKYKIARRLGAPIFEKTQNQKFSLTKAKGGKDTGRPKAKSDFGRQLIEKQKARFTYGVSERQFSKYVKNIIEKKTPKANDALYETLERRLDNLVYRIGLATTRSGARQVVAHGHIMINGRRVTVPSYQFSKGDNVSIREGSLKRPYFISILEKNKDVAVPGWVAGDSAKKVWTVQALPAAEGQNLLFDPGAIFEYYRR
jgi:small subunit ribosomal protein S4